jgi:hypothetical protein
MDPCFPQFHDIIATCCDLARHTLRATANCEMGTALLTSTVLKQGFNDDGARQMSRLPGYIGAVAFTRSGYPDVGWYDRVEILKQFGCFRKALWAAF